MNNPSAVGHTWNIKMKFLHLGINNVIIIIIRLERYSIDIRIDSSHICVYFSIYLCFIFHLCLFISFLFSDINECRCNNGGCPFPYKCINTPGHHYCGCPFGFGGKGNMCHLLVPQHKLNFTLPGNPTVIPKLKPQVPSTTS